MKVGILLSVREKATRLPGKVLKPLGPGTNVTQFLIRRLRTSKLSSEVIVATSDDPRDDVLDALARSEGVFCFKGSQDDKLIRYRDSAKAFRLDFVVVVDGDDPFVSISHIDRIIEHAERASGDLIMFSNLPVGATGFGLRTSALERVCAGRDEQNTEVWGNLFRLNPVFSCIDLAESRPDLARPEIRMTLDYSEDYDFFSAVVDALGLPAEQVTFESVMTYLNRTPQIAAINQGAQEAYEAHLAASSTSKVS